ncbi:NAD(P)/FAD-dependent oxidoreductase, partial [Streptomyces sp. SID625]|nr:NAD(P)/FAD-dependent oxidoreductase [Streptomyces sp. SID625]
NPLGLPLSGLPAAAVTRGYHLAAMPGNRVRVAADWLLGGVLPRQAVQLGLVRSWSVPLDTASPELARVGGGPGGRSGGTGKDGKGGKDGADGAEGAEDESVTEIIDNTEKAQLAGAEPAPHTLAPAPETESRSGRSGSGPGTGAKRPPETGRESVPNRSARRHSPRGPDPGPAAHHEHHPAPGPVKRADIPAEGDS